MMPDREKLIKDIEIQISKPTNEYVVLWFSEAEYVLKLLKEQEHKDRMFRALEDDWKRVKELLEEQQKEIERLKGERA